MTTVFFSGDEQTDGSTRHSAEIELITGDSFFDTIDTPIHFIKIDTQGAEYGVLTGLKNTIEKNKHHLRMIVEFCPWALRNNGHQAMELIDFLREHFSGIHIMDHQQGGLYSSNIDDLLEWTTEVESNPDNQGFLNLFITPSAN